MGLFSLFSSGEIKKLEAEKEELQQKVMQLTSAVDTLKRYGKTNVRIKCAILLVDMNNAAFSIDPDARERVRNFTMIASRAIAVLESTGNQRMLEKLAEEYIPSVINGIVYLSPKTKSIFLDSITSIENVLFDSICNYVEYKQVDAAATLKAMGTAIQMNNVIQLPRGGR